MVSQSIATESGHSSLLIAGEDIPFGAYQAIYHKLTKRVETDRSQYDGAYDLGILDIVNIHDRLIQLIKQYQVKAVRCEVTHGLKDDSSRQHSSFERFKTSDCSLRSCTTMLNYELDFLIILPPEVPQASEIAQRYKLNLSFDQDFIESNDFDAPHFLRNMLIGNNVILSVEYADHAVFKALKATVDGWISTLPTRSPAKIVQFFQKYERGVTRNLPNLARAGAYIGASIYLVNRPDFIPSIAAATVLIGSGVAVVGSIFITYLLEVFYKLLSRFKPVTVLKLTIGDTERSSKMIENGARLTAVISFVGIAIVLSVIMNIMSSYIYDHIFK